MSLKEKIDLATIEIEFGKYKGETKMNVEEFENEAKSYYYKMKQELESHNAKYNKFREGFDKGEVEISFADLVHLLSCIKRKEEYIADMEKIFVKLYGGKIQGEHHDWELHTL